MKAFFVAFSLFFVIFDANAQDCQGPPKVSPETCCPGMPDFISADIRSACQMDGPPKPGGACEMNCAFEKLGLMTAGTVNVDAAKQMAAKMFTGQFAYLTNAFSTCQGELNNSDCGTGRFAGCMMKETIANCPTWNTNNADCANMKACMNSRPF